jgi:hypothetical protein
MGKRLRLTLFYGWVDRSAENPPGGGLAMYVRERSAHPGELRISTAEYQGAKELNLTKDKLIAMALAFKSKDPTSELIESKGGQCRFGHWGTAAFRADQCARAQFWYVSNGRDVIFVTHICKEEANADEVSEAQTIVDSIELVHEK